MSEYRPAWLTEDLAIFQESVRRFTAEELVPHEERWAKQQHVDRETWLKAGEMGMLCPAIPEEYGGGGGSHAHNAIINTCPRKSRHRLARPLACTSTKA